MKYLFVLLILLQSSTTLLAQVNLNQGQVLYMNFNGNANDVSGNGNNGVVNGATLVQDKWGNPNGAYQFDGTNDFIQVANDASLNFPGDSFTFYALVNVQGFYQGTCHGNSILDKGDALDGINGHYSLRFEDNAFTNGQNCAIPQVDTVHQNFTLVKNNQTAPPYYTPPIVKNTWYCVIGVCDGTQIRLYVDGVLMAISNSSGPLGVNNHDLFIGKKNSVGFPYWYNGIIDELRIYNRAINTQEIDALCGYSPDTIINHYAAVQSFDPCTNEFTVDDASDFNAGDTILMVQMKGALIDSSNTAAFGNVLNYNNAGNYEENIIQNIVGNTVTLQNQLLRTYSIPDGKVQIVSIPQFTNYTMNVPHTAAPWDGNKGGIFAMNVTGSLTMNADIDLSSKGFRGGTPSTSSVVNCNKSDYFYPATNNEGGEKGESISEISVAKLYGRGKQASGGGGGNSHNAGGGGGGNAGVGGLGGNQYNLTTCPGPYVSNVGGLGGASINYSSAQNKIFMGGAGGCGHANNQGGNNGGSGGGLIYLKATNLISNTASIISNGENAEYAPTILLGVNDDAGNGGGAGGTILLNSTNVTGNLVIETNGGNGSDAHTATTAPGPGGGGGGGVFWLNQAAIPANVVVTSTGGQNGVVPQVSNTNYGAQPGQPGQTLTGLNMAVATTPFVPFTGVVASNDTTICNGQSAQLAASGAVSYSWSPATGLSNANIANPIATPSTTTQYVVTGLDINGCTDMDTVVVTVTSGITVNVVASRDSICAGENVTLTASGANTYSWTGGVNNGVPFSPAATATYTVTGSDANGCIGTASYTITVLPVPNLSVLPAQPTICSGDTVFFNASGAQSYTWSPSIYLNNPFIANPISVPTANTTYTIVGTNGAGCDTQVVVNVTVKPAANIIGVASKNPICAGESISLTANGGATYAWTGGVTNGVPFTPSATTTYTVTGTNADGCVGTDNVSVTVNPLPVISTLPAEPVVCKGDTVWMSASGAVSYLWSPSATLTTPTSDSTQSFSQQDITYTIIGTDGNGCQGTTTANLNVIESIAMELSKSGDIYCNASPIQLAARGGYNYSWSPASLLNNPNIANPRANITKTTTFYVRSQLGNCVGTDSITVFYYDNTESGIFMPNAFSPNGDGLNDCYNVVSQGNYDQYEFKIFNRWGQAIFETNNPNDCWDGNMGSQSAEVGTYFFYLKASGECGAVNLKGDINLIR